MKALFLDRDGVINKDPYGYFHDYNTIEWNFDLLDFVKDIYQDLPIFIVTNQSGIPKGKFTKQQFLALSASMLEYLDRYGLKVCQIYYSPYSKESYHYSRKPNPGMIMQAQKDWNIDLENSIMIGDKDIDKQASENAGIKEFLFYQEGNIYV